MSRFLPPLRALVSSSSSSSLCFSMLDSIVILSSSSWISSSSSCFLLDTPRCRSCLIMRYEARYPNYIMETKISIRILKSTNTIAALLQSMVYKIGVLPPRTFLANKMPVKIFEKQTPKLEYKCSLVSFYNRLRYFCLYITNKLDLLL